MPILILALHDWPMAWYEKYLPVYEKPFDEVDKALVAEVRRKLAAKQSSDPVASVQIISLNEATRVFACLWSLAENICDYPVEIYATDSGSTDGTLKIYEALGIKCYNQPLRGHGYARQMAMENSRGKYTLTVDSDTLYPPHYMQRFIKELEKPGVVVSGSLTSFLPDELNSVWSLRVYEWIRGIHLRILFLKRPELCMRGMAFGFETQKGLKYGYRTDLKRGEDGSMALVLKKEGKITLITSCKTRIVTRTAPSIKVSQLATLGIKISQVFGKLGYYFSRQEVYEDRDDNLIK